MKEQENKKVFVAMSGGVDSSVSAALLKEAGYDVTGVFIKTWHPDFLPCTWREERKDAMRVAARLGIPFLTCDLSREYKRDVVDYMVNEYKVGRTPNPDVMCNKQIKFGAFFDWARAQGADMIATGHYAQVVQEDEWYALKQGTDKNKDQSYFLWILSQEVLAHTLFPVGEYTKDKVREMAAERDLFVANKKDSQGVCFLGEITLPDFLEHFVELEAGDVLDKDGSVIGSHSGALQYTVGQRHGFTVAVQSPSDAPRYVVEKDVATNTLVVAPELPPFALEVKLEQIHWILEEPKSDVRYYARIRHRGQLEPCRLENELVIFDEPVTALAAGQSCVLYTENGTCLGGGVVSKVLY